MKFLELVAAFFYLQPSLLISFVPIQIIFLFICLSNLKKMQFLKAFCYSFAATIFAFILIILTGLIIVPFIYVRFFQLIEISYKQTILIFVISVFLYWLSICLYLSNIFKLKKITYTAALSSAFAGSSVLALSYLLWQK
jgi:hypothetical protein